MPFWPVPLYFGTEDVHLRALDVVLGRTTTWPTSSVRVGVDSHAALEDRDLRCKVGKLFGSHIGGVAEDTVLRRLRGIIVVGGSSTV